MSKIEEALAKAAQARQEGNGRAPAAPPAAAAAERRGELEVVSVDPLQLTESRVVVASSPTLGASDAYRQLRTSLMLAVEQKRLALLITSPLQGDGKSLTTLNLGYAIAQEIHLDAVVVDADLRRPALARFLGLPPRPGLSDYLSDASLGIEDCAVRLDGGPVVVLAGTRQLDNTSELLGSQRMQSFCVELRRRFPEAVLLFDSPPVLPAPDAMALMRWLDGALFVVSAGRTSRKALVDAVRQFGATRIAGIVVNRNDEGRRPYGYRYYGGYRYSYGEERGGEAG